MYLDCNAWSACGDKLINMCTRGGHEDLKSKLLPLLNKMSQKGAKPPGPTKKQVAQLRHAPTRLTISKKTTIVEGSTFGGECGAP